MSLTRLLFAVAMSSIMSARLSMSFYVSVRGLIMFSRLTWTYFVFRILMIAFSLRLTGPFGQGTSISNIVFARGSVIGWLVDTM